MSQLIEEWRPVPGHEGAFEVSNLGRVRSLSREVTTSHGRRWRMEGRILTSSPNRAGYPMVRLAWDGKVTTRRVATLVALAFLGPRPEGAILRHLDDDRTNSRADNLAYGTHAENAQDRVRNGRDANARKTHCPQGHPYDEANTGRTKQGWRHCRACARERAAARKEGLR